MAWKASDMEGFAVVLGTNLSHGHWFTELVSDSS